MKLTSAIDSFLADAQREGRINSRNTLDAYAAALYLLADDVGNRDPAKIGVADIKRWLDRWPNPNTRVQRHAIANSFFDHARYEGWCKGNIARDVRPARRRQPVVSRITREETARLLEVSNDRRRDRWVAHLGCCAGLRSQEIRGLQGRHFARPGFVWVSQDIGKSGKERWIPATADLAPVIEEILTLIGLEEHVIPGQRSAGHPTPEIMRDVNRGVSASALYKQVVALGRRADMAVKVTPHTLRRSFATYVTKHAGIRVARSLMGHEEIGTTQKYTNEPTLDELAISLHGFSFFGAEVPRHQTTQETR